MIYTKKILNKVLQKEQHFNQLYMKSYREVQKKYTWDRRTELRDVK